MSGKTIDFLAWLLASSDLNSSVFYLTLKKKTPSTMSAIKRRRRPPNIARTFIVVLDFPSSAFLALFIQTGHDNEFKKVRLKQLYTRQHCFIDRKDFFLATTKSLCLLNIVRLEAKYYLIQKRGPITATGY